MGGVGVGVWVACGCITLRRANDESGDRLLTTHAGLNHAVDNLQTNAQARRPRPSTENLEVGETLASLVISQSIIIS